MSLGDGRQLFWAHLGLVHCLLLCSILLARSHRLSQRRVGVSYALRVFPALTRLTVYRRPQVIYDLANFGLHVLLNFVVSERSRVACGL